MTIAVITVAVFGVFFLLAYLISPSENEVENRRLGADERFKSRGCIFSRAEASFYGTLRLALGDAFVAFPKVRMADVLQPVQSGKEGKRAFCEISQKHVDYVICRIGTWEMVGALELDDSSHRRSKREVRDTFVNIIFSGAGIPLVRIPAQASYSVQELRGKLADIMNTQSRQMASTELKATS